MTTPADVRVRLQLKVSEQLQSQRVGYLLGAGSSYVDGKGYPLAGELWNAIKDRVKDPKRCSFKNRSAVLVPDRVHVEILQPCFRRCSSSAQRASRHFLDVCRA